MTMSASPDSVAPGVVRFEIRNTGTVRHELVVMRTTQGLSLRVNGDGVVSEVGAVGAIRNIAPNESKALTLTLSTGTYELVCNRKGHYELADASAVQRQLNPQGFSSGPPGTRTRNLRIKSPSRCHCASGP